MNWTRSTSKPAWIAILTLIAILAFFARSVMDPQEEGSRLSVWEEPVEEIDHSEGQNKSLRDFAPMPVSSREVTPVIEPASPPLSLQAAIPDLQSQGSGLLFERTDLDLAIPGQAGRLDPNEVVSRSAIRVAWDTLREIREQGYGALEIDLGEKGALIASVGSVSQNWGSGYSLSGELDGYPESSFLATVHEDVLLASIRKGGKEDENFEVIVNQKGQQEIRQLNHINLPQCNLTAGSSASPELDGSVSRMGKVELGENAAAAGELTVIDVMVAYTALARETSGGSNGMIAAINHVVGNANIILLSSDVPVLYRLVHTLEVDYNEWYHGTSQSALNDLGFTDDGDLDEIHGARDTYGADIVSLWTSVDYGGRAYLLRDVSPSSEGRAFNVCGAAATRTLFKLNYLFSHECGHNLGCDHNVEASYPPQPYPYSYGWQWVGNDNVEYRSIMAYGPGKIVYQFSNPNLSYMGVPTGTSTADNALTINNTRATVGSYRASVSTLPVLQLSSTKKKVGPKSANHEFQVMASEDWTWSVNGGGNWVKIREVRPQDGIQKFSYSVSSNSGSARTARIVFSSGAASVTHTISQTKSKKPALRKKIKKLRRQLRTAKRNLQKSKVKGLEKRIKKLNSQLRKL